MILGCKLTCSCQRRVRKQSLSDAFLPAHTFGFLNVYRSKANLIACKQLLMYGSHSWPDSRIFADTPINYLSQDIRQSGYPWPIQNAVLCHHSSCHNVLSAERREGNDTCQHKVAYSSEGTDVCSRVLRAWLLCVQTSHNLTCHPSQRASHR